MRNVDIYIQTLIIVYWSLMPESGLFEFFVNVLSSHKFSQVII